MIGVADEPCEATTYSTFPYPGGKGRKVQAILDVLPAHQTFIDAFGGSGSVIYRKEPSPTEIYNDRNTRLTAFFQTIGKEYEAVAKELAGIPYSRALYAQFADEYGTNREPTNPVIRAAREFFLRFASVDSGIEGGFKASATRNAAQSYSNGIRRLSDIQRRFSHVVIEEKDVLSLIDDYGETARDGDPERCFFFDPPYRGKDVYGVPFEWKSFIDAVRDLESYWILTCETLPSELEEYPRSERAIQRRVHTDSADRVEYIIRNFGDDVAGTFGGPNASLSDGFG